MLLIVEATDYSVPKGPFGIQNDFAYDLIWDFPRVLPYFGLQSPKIRPRNPNMIHYAPSK